MTDIYGPASADNAVTARPSDGRQYGAGDSWFKDCSSPSSDDGTETEAAWFNQVTAVLRSLARINGKKADGLTLIVPEDGSDGMALAGLRHLIQRGQLNAAADSGAANAAVATLPLTPAELIDGLEVDVRMAAAPTGAATLVLTGFAAFPVRRRGGLVLLGGEWAANDWVKLRWNASGGYWQMMATTRSDIGDALGVLRTLQNTQQFRNSTRTILSGATAPVLAWTPTSAGGVSSYTKKSATSNLLVIMQLVNYTTGLGAAIVNLTIGALTRQSVASVGVSNYISIGQIPKIDLITAADLGNPAAGTALPLSITTSRPDGQSWSQTMNPTTADSNQFPSATASTSVLIIGEIEPSA